MRPIFGIWPARKVLYPTATMAITLRRRTLSRLLLVGALVVLAKLFLFTSGSTSKKSTSHQIQRHNFIERATRPDKSLNVQRHPFLQSRMGRDERPDIFSDLIFNGVMDYWERFQLP